MKYTFQLAILFTVICALIKTDTFDLSLIGVVADYVFDAVESLPRELLSSPTNSDNSIQYLLYTPKNRNEPCLIQPSAKQFDRCSFSASYETKFLIHGFAEFLTKENLFNVLKDAILQHDNYNVIIVNWTSSNSIPFRLAYRKAKLVGDKLAEMMKFMETHAKVSLKTFHCIGHSLGCHICGVAGRIVHTLARITGVDPGGISMFKRLRPNIRLNYTDAAFVDVVHTSNIFALRGLGYLDPCGHLDFYPNGGVNQPGCAKGNTYKVFKGKSLRVQTTLDLVFCNHFIAIEYFTYSLQNNSKFVATACNSYSDFEKGLCSSGIKAEMGFFSKKLEGIPPMTKFYLNTLDSPPYYKE